MNTCFLVTIGNVPPRTPATQLHSFTCHSGGQNVCCEVDEGMESTIQLQVGSGRISSVFCCEQRNHVSCCLALQRTLVSSQLRTMACNTNLFDSHTASVTHKVFLVVSILIAAKWMFETWSFSLRFLHVINALTTLLEKLLCCCLSTCEEQRRILKEPKFSVKKNHVKSVIEWVTVVAWGETSGNVGGAAAVKRRCEGWPLVVGSGGPWATWPNHDQIGSWSAMVCCSALMDMALDFRSIQSNYKHHANGHSQFNKDLDDLDWFRMIPHDSAWFRIIGTFLVAEVKSRADKARPRNISVYLCDTLWFVLFCFSGVQFCGWERLYWRHPVTTFTDKELSERYSRFSPVGRARVGGVVESVELDSSKWILKARSIKTCTELHRILFRPWIRHIVDGSNALAGVVFLMLQDCCHHPLRR